MGAIGACDCQSSPFVAAAQALGKDEPLTVVDLNKAKRVIEGFDLVGIVEAFGLAVTVLTKMFGIDDGSPNELNGFSQQVCVVVFMWVVSQEALRAAARCLRECVFAPSCYYLSLFL